ncbi:hypothetical protein LZG04_11535 [Saccharothrix sp. S26]|uniref:hypothetical protein n=1 Tax=Saccharothrix sp. S26 TaxID=2907215 RepID=UPI001F159C1A|nr:hypothetical protein [Saccharothrix sp. S26]MCE6995434.1 hypothetical protein [Saccharothrix sp. S26]
MFGAVDGDVFAELLTDQQRDLAVHGVEQTGQHGVAAQWLTARPPCSVITCTMSSRADASSEAKSDPLPDARISP